MRRAVAVAVAAALAPLGALAQSVVVRAGERDVTVDLARLTHRRVAVRDRTDQGRPKTFVAVPLSEVLAALPGPADSDALAVRCDDGWLSLLPRDRVGAGLLAVAVEAAPGRDAPIAPPRGPVFLVWPNVDRPALDADAELNPYGWTFGAAVFEYVRRADALARSAAPAKAPATVHRGADLFRQHCLHCHAMNGFGGLVAWDLNAPSIIAYRGEARVRAYLADPRALLPDGKMPAFRQLPRRDIDALIGYLKAQAPP